MKRIVPLLLLTGLTASWIGCQPATDSKVPESRTDAAPSATSDYILVTLKVPNMT
jgi:hypothetical protein